MVEYLRAVVHAGPDLPSPGDPSEDEFVLFFKTITDGNGEVGLYGLRDVGTWTKIGVPQGGTSDQVLSKASAEDYDVRWSTPAGGGEAFAVGSVHITVVPTNPSILLGYGTWVQIAQGKCLVGQDAGDADFDTAEETGGAKTHTLTENEMPAHTHVQSALTSTSGTTSQNNRDTSSSGNGATNSVTQSAGGGAAHNNVPPYFVVFVWKRTA